MATGQPIMWESFSVLLFEEQTPGHKFCIAHCLELDVVSQGDTYEEAIECLSSLVDLQVQDIESGNYEHPQPAPQEYFECFDEGCGWSEGCAWEKHVELCTPKGKVPANVRFSARDKPL